jgi:hypothetical protein
MNSTLLSHTAILNMRLIWHSRGALMRAPSREMQRCIGLSSKQERQLKGILQVSGRNAVNEKKLVDKRHAENAILSNRFELLAHLYTVQILLSLCDTKRIISSFQLLQHHCDRRVLPSNVLFLILSRK